MKKISVRASREYEVLIGSGLAEKAGELVKQVHAPCRTVIVTDSNVAPLWLGKVKVSLEKAGFTCSEYVFPAGEASKNTAELIKMVEFFAESGLTRTDLVVALGGGVTGDMAGFASAIFLRGIEFVQIPTTLLAMTDSSVGGKTAVDLEAGKNLCGAFHQPSLVICDTDTLSTLPADEFSGGCAEIIKYGVIKDASLFEALEDGLLDDDPAEVIARCVGIKRDVVEADEFDKGERQLLNFGHTAGHAIEKQSNFTLSHGQSVAMGMIIASLAVGKKEIAQRIAALENKMGLSSACPYTADLLLPWCMSDKKKAGGSLTLVVPEEIGHCVLKKIPASEVLSFLECGLSR